MGVNQTDTRGIRPARFRLILQARGGGCGGGGRRGMDACAPPFLFPPFPQVPRELRSLRGSPLVPGVRLRSLGPRPRGPRQVPFLLCCPQVGEEGLEGSGVGNNHVASYIAHLSTNHAKKMLVIYALFLWRISCVAHLPCFLFAGTVNKVGWFAPHSHTAPPPQPPPKVATRTRGNPVSQPRLHFFCIPHPPQ